MPFVDITLSEREKFVNQTSGCNIPGYTGHCPTLRFQFGKPYGAITKSINEKVKNLSADQGAKIRKEKGSWSNTSMETTKNQEDFYHLSNVCPFPRRTFILGYTGFIPGINFEYGLPFYNAAHKSLSNFALKQMNEEKRTQKERIQFTNTKPSVCCAKGCDEAAMIYEPDSRPLFSNTKTLEPPPPIAGYTGHIPGIKGNEASLGRYYSAAKAGLSMVKEKRKKDRRMFLAQKAVADALNYF